MAEAEAIAPVFDNPPVVETVLGVQFAPLQGMTSGHLGWFWKGFLDVSWEKVVDAYALPDMSENFETPIGGLGIQVGPVPLPQRFQISQPNTGRMIQVQPTRFHYNWNRVGGDYPHYKSVREEFDRYFGAFCHFTQEAGFGAIRQNQWELTYIDSIPKGSLWETVADWHEVLPGLFSRPPAVEDVGFESFGGEWHFEIRPRKGRVHVSVQLARVGSEPEPVLLLQTTARGPIGNGAAVDVGAGLELGHRAALDVFLAITSEKAKEAWRRRS
jgi:uncharacterized protein (TIGR04255 family)